MYIGHACLSVCLSVAACPHYCMEPDVTWGVVVVPHSCALLGGFAIGAGFCCYDNIQVCNLVALYTANAYSIVLNVKCHQVHACTRSVSGFFSVTDVFLLIMNSISIQYIFFE